MVDFKYELDDKKLKAVLNRAFGMKAGGAFSTFAIQMRSGMKKAMRWFKKKHQIARLSGTPGLERRSGDLVKSFVVGNTKPGTPIMGIEAWLATRSKYAQIHEEGGTVRAKNPAGFLAIPLDGAKTPAGNLKNMFAGKSLRDVPGLFCEKSSSGKLLLWMDTPGGVVPMFVLKKAVDIPPRLRFFDMWSRWSGVLTKKFLAPALDKAWKVAQRGAR